MKPLPRFTPQTPTTLKALKALLAEDRKRGYAVDDEEHVAGLRCVAAVVAAEGSDAICAISVSGLANRLTSTRVSVAAGRVVGAQPSAWRISSFFRSTTHRPTAMSSLPKGGCS